MNCFFSAKSFSGGGFNIQKHMPLIGDIIRGQANYVMRCLGKGHSENVYHRALITAMNKAGVAHRSEVSCPIWFMGECIGMGRADMVIENVIIEIKANKFPPKATSDQLQKYLVSLSQAEKKHYSGVVVNFNQKTGLVDIYQDELHSRKESEVFKRSLENTKSQESGVHLWETFRYKRQKSQRDETP